MLEMLFPSRLCESAYLIPYEHYRSKGYKGIIFDIDNTLVEHDAPASAKARALFHRLHGLGFKTCVLSNNKEKRVKTFAQAVGCAYVYKGGKPKRTGYRKAMEKMGTVKADTLFVGDQLFTDIWGANRAGLFCVLVRPVNPKEEIQIVLKRFLEVPVLWVYKYRLKRKRR